MAKSGSLTGKRKRFRISNFLGGMNTVAEDNNVFTLDPNALLGNAFTQVRTEFRNLDNWLPLKRGGISKAPGFELFKNTGSTDDITGLYRYIKADGTSLFLYSQGTAIYKLVAGTATSIGATITSGAYTHFETALDKLVYCDGVLAPKTWDGTTVAALTNGPSVLRATLWTQNRLFGFGNTGTNASYVYYSDAGTLDNMANNFISCDVNDGQKITAIARFFIPGTLEPVIIVGKERSIGIITGSGTASDPYTFSKIAFDVGIPGFRQIVQYGQDAAMLTPQGVISYQTALQDANIKRNAISQKVEDQFTELLQTYLDDSIGWFDWKNNLVRFAVPHSTDTVPSRIWTFDPVNGGWYKQTGFNLTAVFVDTDGTVYHGDDTGKIYQTDGTADNYNGEPIEAVARTGFIDFFEPDYYKRIVHASITIRGNGAYGLTCATRLDYGTKDGTSHNITITSGGYTWGGGTWTSNSATYQWGGASLLTKNFFPGGIFKNIDFTFTQDGEDEPLDILDMTFEIEYLGVY